MQAATDCSTDETPVPRGRREHVVVVGGGLAGLAATAALADRGLPVTLLESRPRLGGRATSFTDRDTGETIDNCQHVGMGCCTNLRHLCETVGIGDGFSRESTLYFVGPDGVVNEFRAAPWPAPLHLLSAFRRLSYLDRNDRRALSRGLLALARTDPATVAEETFDTWLARHEQPRRAIDRFWTVVLVSALGESLDRIAVPAARKVFVDGFLSHRDGWRMEVPRAPLETLYGDRLVNWLTERGAVVRLGAGVERLEEQGGVVTRARLRSREAVAGSQFVLAVPHGRVAELVPESLRSHPSVTSLADLETAPISSVHLWFDRPITDLPHAVFVDRTSQWLFAREAATKAARHHSGGTAHYYQIVISASRRESRLPREELVDRVLAELRATFPAAREAELLHARRVTEHDAVFSPTPASEALRPPQQSPLDNLQFAGDWTRTGWPATMEGAVRSGYLAAQNVLARLGRPETLLQPDLPRGRLSRWLIGAAP